jgi:hypothetical protein
MKTLNKTAAMIALTLALAPTAVMAHTSDNEHRYLVSQNAQYRNSNNDDGASTLGGLFIFGGIAIGVVLISGINKQNKKVTAVNAEIKAKQDAEDIAKALKAFMMAPLIPQSTLPNGELIYHECDATAYEPKVIHARARVGASIPIHFQGIRLYGSTSPKDRTEWQDQGTGRLRFTDKHILFTTPIGNLSIPYSKVLEITHCTDGFHVIRENKPTLMFFTSKSIDGYALTKIMMHDEEIQKKVC